MAHLISEIDSVFSNKGKEWHNLAIHDTNADGSPVTLDEKHLSRIMFPLEAMKLEAFHNGESRPGVPFPEYKAIAADLRSQGRGMVPLAIHGENYRPIPNLEIFRAVKDGLKEVPHDITTCGTLDSLRRFFVSVELKDAPGYEVRGDRFKAFVNFISSHDGTLTLQGYDSSVRIVCNNTLNASLGAKGKLSATVRHTTNASVHINRMSEWLGNVLAVRKQQVSDFERLLDTPLAPREAMSALQGLLWLETSKPDSLSTRTVNQIMDIHGRYLGGMGNRGASAYDLLNGYTEYYTHGAGTGKAELTDLERRANGSFGGASGKKSEFAALLCKVDKVTGKTGLVELMEAAEAGGSKAFHASAN